MFLDSEGEDLRQRSEKCPPSFLGQQFEYDEMQSINSTLLEELDGVIETLRAAGATIFTISCNQSKERINGKIAAILDPFFEIAGMLIVFNLI